MIRLFRTYGMEAAANLLLKESLTVAVRATYRNYIPSMDRRVRFRADDIKDPRVFFGKVPSQVDLWQQRGGLLVWWNERVLETPHDVMLFAECPYGLEVITRQTVHTRHAAIVYLPPTMAAFEAVYSIRYAPLPNKLKRMREKLAIVHGVLEQCPAITPFLARRLRAPAPSQSSSVPVLRESEARSLRIGD